MDQKNQGSKGVKEGILFPALKSLITGVFVVLVALAVLSIRGGQNSWQISLLIGAIAALLTWLVVIVPRPEKALQDVTLIKPQAVETTRIMVTGDQNSFTRGTWADLPISPDMLRQVSLRLQNGGSFSHSSLAGPGKPLTRAQFENLRDLMIARNLAYWINPDAHAQGIALTRAGEAVIKYFCQGDNIVTLPLLPQQSKMSTIVDKLPSTARARERSSERR